MLRENETFDISIYHARPFGSQAYGYRIGCEALP